jgi:23S rRNA (cytosine1962-C5)-methyltransferase
MWLRAGCLRAGLLPPGDATRWVHGTADGFPGQVVERYGNAWLLSELTDRGNEWLRARIKREKGVIKKYLGGGRVEVEGRASPAGPLVAVENGLRYEICLDESTTSGLFLDQRENRLWLRRFLARAPEGPVLNCFAHTCSFSVVAAVAGRKTASVDLSPAYLDWGKRNFALNGMPETGHRWLKGDSGDWIKRLEKRGEKFAAIILDPPSFSRSKEGDFQAERDLPKLAAEAAKLLVPGGALLAATNLRKWAPGSFLAKMTGALKGSKLTTHRLPLPPDFPHAAGEELWMKSVWMVQG